MVFELLRNSDLDREAPVGFSCGRRRVREGWERFSVESGAPMEGMVYLPPGLRRPNLTLVAVHGIGRDYEEQSRHWQALADEMGAALLIPHFDVVRFQGYQRLSGSKGGPKADWVFLRLLAWLDHCGYGLPSHRFMVGHSGGAQFVHRFLMAHRFMATGAILSSAGWYTFPNSSLPFPMGTGSRYSGSMLHGNLEHFLRIPMFVTVGERDTDRDEALRKNPSLDQEQGRTRVERAGKWVEVLRSEADKRNIPHEIELHLLPGAGHAFEECAGAGLVDLTRKFLHRWG